GNQADYVRLANPISSERVVMRQSLLASVLEIASSNLRHTEDIRLFEIGTVYLPRSGQELPDEPRRLAVVMTGERTRQFWQDGQTPGQKLDFFDLKGVLESLAADLHLEAVSYRPSTVEYLHPGRAAELLLASLPIGDFGQLHPKIAS